MSGAIPPLSQYAFMGWCAVKRRDNFTFYLYLYLYLKYDADGSDAQSRPMTGFGSSGVEPSGSATKARHCYHATHTLYENNH
jgi:hypothetical protein